MESRWLRILLLLAVMALFLGTAPRASSAAEPNIIAEVRAYNTSQQAALIDLQPIGSGARESSNRAKKLYAVPIQPGARFHTMVDISEIVSNVSSRLVDIQRSDHGWPRDLSDSTEGPNELVPNNYGIVGLALLAAWDMSSTGHREGGKLKISRPNSRLLNAARAAGDALLAQDPNKLVSTDIVFLYALSKAVDETRLSRPYYEAGLSGLKEFVKQYPTADAVSDLYEASDSGLRQLKIWQMASWVEAAKLYGKEAGLQDPNMGTWADALMAKICEFQDAAGGFYYLQNNGRSYVRTAGQAKAVEVLKRFYAYQNKPALRKGLAYLKGLQFTATKVDPMCGSFYWGGETVDGRLTPWNGISLQDQCYGIKAMAYNFQTTWKRRDFYKGTYWGLNYLIKSMMAKVPDQYEVFVDRIGFTVSGEYATPRVDRNSEAICALYFSCKEGDVTKLGNITAYNALQVLKACVGKGTLLGPQLIAADRSRDGGEDEINEHDILAILADSVADRVSINTVLDLLD
ncbi:MAG: hypothetical protein K6U11_01050 [bacterium]|nr:hypothetical protein [bacterium]